MLEIEAALKQIIESILPLDNEAIPLHQAGASFAANVIYASVPLPGFDNSSMDGYALRASDSLSQNPLPVVAEQPAGLSKNLSLNPGEAIRIFTGAAMPHGADAVIMQEDVDLIESPHSRLIRCREPVAPGENLRKTGADVCLGQQLLQAGDPLTPTRLALLASQGLATVNVTRKPRIAIITTGDELVPPGSTLAPGQLYNSNGILLQSLCSHLGIVDTTHHHLADDLNATVAMLRELIASQDFILLSGGVSVGDYDHVKPALETLGFPPHFWRINMRPGKPLLHTIAGKCHLFGLPGNPVSSYVTFQLFVRPALLKSMGARHENLSHTSAQARLTLPIDNPGNRPHFIRGTYKTQDQTFTPIGLQQSHALYGLSQSNALLRLDPQQSLQKGSFIRVWLP